MQQKTKCARLKLEVLSCSHISLVTSLNNPEGLQNLASRISFIIEFIWEVISPSYIAKVKEAVTKLTLPVPTSCCKFLKHRRLHYTSNLDNWPLVTDFIRHLKV